MRLDYDESDGTRRALAIGVAQCVPVDLTSLLYTPISSKGAAQEPMNRAARSRPRSSNIAEAAIDRSDALKK